MALKISVSGEASASCDRCGWDDYWEWDDEYGEQPPSISTSCPNCDDAPFLLRWRRRIRYEWREWRRRGRAPEFLPSVWSADVLETIESAEVLGNLLKQDDGVPGKTLHVPEFGQLTSDDPS